MRLVQLEVEAEDLQVEHHQWSLQQHQLGISVSHNKLDRLNKLNRFMHQFNVCN